LAQPPSIGNFAPARAEDPSRLTLVGSEWIETAQERTARMIPRLNSFWIGDELGYVEKLTLASALSVGHPFTIYSYAAEKLRGVPSGVEVRDANEVVPYRALAHYFEGGSAALGTDFFRYAMQAKGLGVWADLDLYFLRPIDFDDEYLFGWEHKTSINGAVLRLPANSDMVRELCDIPHVNWRPPFYGPRKTAIFYWRRLTEGDLRPENYRWGTFGPMVLTYLARKYGVAKSAKKPSIFYPVSHQDWKLLCGPPELVKATLTKETRTVHLWRSVLIRLMGPSPPRGSYLEALCHALGLTVAASTEDDGRIDEAPLLTSARDQT
jgi:hypothetical protein